MRMSHLIAQLLLCGLLTARLAAATAVASDFPIWLELDKSQLVTVVIEDAHGVRMRNLVTEMPLGAAPASLIRRSPLQPSFTHPDRPL